MSRGWFCNSSLNELIILDDLSQMSDHGEYNNHLHISPLYHSDDDFKHSVAEAIAKQLEEVSVSYRYHNGTYQSFCSSIYK